MASRSRAVHPLVSLDYRVRVPAMVIVALVLATDPSDDVTVPAVRREPEPSRA